MKGASPRMRQTVRHGHGAPPVTSSTSWWWKSGTASSVDATTPDLLFIGNLDRSRGTASLPPRRLWVRDSCRCKSTRWRLTRLAYPDETRVQVHVPTYVLSRHGHSLQSVALGEPRLVISLALTLFSGCESMTHRMTAVGRSAVVSNVNLLVPVSVM